MKTYKQFTTGKVEPKTKKDWELDLEDDEKETQNKKRNKENAKAKKDTAKENG